MSDSGWWYLSFATEERFLGAAIVAAPDIANASVLGIVSGDVTLLAGPTRHYLHTIERIEPAMALLAPSPLEKPGRLAISLRCAG